MLMAAIMLIAIMTVVLSQSPEQQSDIITRQTSDSEINRLIDQATTLQMAVNQMLMNGEDPKTLYSSLSALPPSAAGFETAPHALKIYHPMGGGVKYMAGTSDAADAVATGFNIIPNAIVLGVGPTDAVIGDILFTAKISSADACGKINLKLSGAAAIPVMVNADFNTLFNAEAAIIVNNLNCANCVNITKTCVSNTTGDEWGFYLSLLPG